MKGQRYFAEINLSRGVLVPINCENRGVGVIFFHLFQENLRCKHLEYMHRQNCKSRLI